MPYICRYNLCPRKGTEAQEGEAVSCSKDGLAMHPECFSKHNGERHGGKATADPLPEPDFEM
jgi:hypothetical protein